MGHHAEARAENDLEVDVRAEREIELILQHLIALVWKLNMDGHLHKGKP
jgi:uncharacterized membrane protein